MFFAYNTKLGPPYHVLIDTNFITLCFKNKLDIHKSVMDCLYAKCKFRWPTNWPTDWLTDWSMDQLSDCLFDWLVDYLSVFIVVGTCYITDCVLAEMEKMGPKYSLSVLMIKDPRFVRLPCIHKGTYADDCLVERVTQVGITPFPMSVISGRLT